MNHPNHPNKIGTSWSGKDYVHGPRKHQPSRYSEFRLGKATVNGKRIVWGKVKGTNKWEIQSSLIPKSTTVRTHRRGKSIVRKHKRRVIRKAANWKDKVKGRYVWFDDRHRETFPRQAVVQKFFRQADEADNFPDRIQAISKFRGYGTQRKKAQELVRALASRGAEDSHELLSYLP
jgi:hypothetical protein